MILKIVGIGRFIYLSWAITHHKRNKSLTLPILLEYLLTATLAIILMAGMFI